MANYVTPHAKHLLGAAGLNLSTADLRVLLVMSNSTAAADLLTAEDLADITTLDEHDGANYARQPLANEAYAKDVPNARTELDADDVTFASLGAGTRQCIGAILYVHVDGTAANDIPIRWIDTPGFPFTAAGADFELRWNAEGVLQVA